MVPEVPVFLQRLDFLRPLRHEGHIQLRRVSRLIIFFAVEESVRGTGCQCQTVIASWSP